MRFSVRVRAAGRQRSVNDEIAGFQRLCRGRDRRRQGRAELQKLPSILVHEGLADRSRYGDRERVQQRTSKQEFAARRAPSDIRRGSRARFENAVFRGHRGRQQTSGQRGTLRATLSEHRRVSVSYPSKPPNDTRISRVPCVCEHRFIYL